MTRKQALKSMSIADTVLFCSMLQEVEYVQRLCEVGKAFKWGYRGLQSLRSGRLKPSHTGIYLNLIWTISLEFHLEVLG